MQGGLGILYGGVNARAIIGVDEWVGQAGNEAGVDTTLYTYTLPANGLRFDGDSIDFEFRLTLSGDPVTVTAYFNADSVVYFNGTPENVSAVMRGRVMRTGESSQLVFGDFLTGVFALPPVSAVGSGPRFNDMAAEATLMLKASSGTINACLLAAALVNFRGVKI